MTSLQYHQSFPNSEGKSLDKGLIFMLLS